MIVTREAVASDLAWIWPAAHAAHLFADPEDLRAWWVAGPWRVRVGADGEAAVVGRWRDHLDVLAVRGLWCVQSRVPVMVSDLEALARERGLGRVMAPLVPETGAGPYLAAGMRIEHRIVAMHRRITSADGRGGEARAVVMREAPAAHGSAMLALDERCFDEFWRYDAPSMSEALAGQRAAVAERAGRAIGYTLAAVHGRSGSLGRVAVAPEERRRGIGRALVREALAWMAREGATDVTLSTQLENAAARALYRSEGFRERPGTLVGLLTAADAGSGR